MDSSIPAGARSAAARTHRCAAACSRASPQTDLCGAVPRGGHRFGGLGRDVRGSRVVEQGGQGEHHRGPDRVGHAVEVAHLQESAGPHRREQRGQVVVQIGDRRSAVAEQHPPVGPVRERHPLRDRRRIGVVHQHDRRAQRVAGPVTGRVVAALAEDRPAPRRVQLAPHPLTRGLPPGEAAVEHRRVRGDRDHRRAQCMRQPHPVGPRPPWACLDVDLHRRGRGHHRRACGTGLAGVEELFHRVVAGPRVHPRGRPQRVGAEQHQTQPGLREGRAQRRPVRGHGRDRRRRIARRRAREFDGTARFDGDQTAARQRRQRRDRRRQLVPPRSSRRIGQVITVRLDLEPDPAHRTVRQAPVEQVLCGDRCAGQFLCAAQSDAIVRAIPAALRVGKRSLP